MKIAIKYPRKKFIEVNTIIDLQNKLNVLMIIKFDIKSSISKPFTDIKTNINSSNISIDDFIILQKENSIIIPTDISQCKI